MLQFLARLARASAYQVRRLIRQNPAVLGAVVLAVAQAIVAEGGLISIRTAVTLAAGVVVRQLVIPANGSTRSHQGGPRNGSGPLA